MSYFPNKVCKLAWRLQIGPRVGEHTHDLCVPEAARHDERSEAQRKVVLASGAQCVVLVAVPVRTTQQEV